MADHYFYRPRDIAAILDRSERYAYDVIKKLNDELAQKGFEVERGRVPRSYFHERYNLAMTDKAPAQKAPKARKSA